MTKSQVGQERMAVRAGAVDCGGQRCVGHERTDEKNWFFLVSETNRDTSKKESKWERQSRGERTRSDRDKLNETGGIAYRDGATLRLNKTEQEFMGPTVRSHSRAALH